MQELNNLTLDLITESILEDAKKIETKLVAQEVLNWLIGNVEYFIDNHNKIFKLDLVLDTSTESLFPEAKKLQDLYRRIPEDQSKSQDIDNLEEEDKIKLEKIGNIRSELDTIVQSTHECMKQEKELLEQLFKRMSFYYELRGVHKGDFIIEKIVGGVAILDFQFDSFSVPVVIKQKVVSEDGEQNISERAYVIPEGFSVSLEIAFSSAKKRATLF